MITIGTIAKLPDKKEGYIEYARNDDFACNQCGGDIRSKTCCNPELSDKEIGYNQARKEISQIPISEEKLKDLGYIHKSKLLGFASIKSIISSCICKAVVFVGGKIPSEALNLMANEFAEKIVQAQEKGINNENRN